MVLFMMPAVGSIFPLVVPLALMSIASEDDREYMVALYLKYSRRLFAYALKITRNRQVAEDAVHDAFVSLISNVSELRQMEGGRLEGYVFVTVKNAAFMIVRKERTMARAEYEAAAPDNTSDEKFFIISADNRLEMKKKERELADEREKVEILKNPCTSLCNHPNEVRSDLRAQLQLFGEEDVQSAGAAGGRALPPEEGGGAEKPADPGGTGRHPGGERGF